MRWKSEFTAWSPSSFSSSSAFFAYERSVLQMSGSRAPTSSSILLQSFIFFDEDGYVCVTLFTFSSSTPAQSVSSLSEGGRALTGAARGVRERLHRHRLSLAFELRPAERLLFAHLDLHLRKQSSSANGTLSALSI